MVLGRVSPDIAPRRRVLRVTAFISEIFVSIRAKDDLYRIVRLSRPPLAHARLCVPFALGAVSRLGPMSRVFRGFLCGAGLSVFFLISACTGAAHAPIVSKHVKQPGAATVSSNAGRAAPPQRRTEARPASYRVKRGDTLYSIAWRFGLDHRELARWNGLDDPNLIFSGQQLRLAPSTKIAKPVHPRTTAASVGTRDQTDKAKTVSVNKATSSTRSGSATDAPQWIWPAAGRVKIAATALAGNRALEIYGNRGDAVRAAAHGKIVYSGSGLRGYGKLIIIKHGDTFLSAYAHNDKLLVAEGASVERGQEIAEMGDSEAKDVMLHFEIRRNGKVVEPLKYLPQR